MKILFILMTMINPSLKKDKIFINKTYKVENSEKVTVIIDNIQGDVIVESTGDDIVSLSLEIWIEADSDRGLEKAKRDLKLGEDITEDSIIFYTKAPFIKRNSWGTGWSNNVNISMESLGYDFKYQYSVKVPKNVILDAHTINRGDVFVKNVDGPIKACNVNGEVEIKNARKILHASTVNGDVTINFLESPKQAIDFNTVNGDFNFELPDNFNAQVYFNSMHGDLYTSFDYKR
ncbi:MAG: DUF4097 family beta strand repeat-containing protein, partial [Bacteroidota bacterium]